MRRVTAVEGWPVAMVAAAVAFVHALGVEWSHPGSADVGFFLMLCGLVVICTLDQIAGALVIYAGIVVDAVSVFGSSDGVIFEYYTNVCVTITAVGLVASLALWGLTRLLERCGCNVACLRIATALCCTFSRGAAVALALLTTCLMALYDGRDLHSIIVWYDLPQVEGLDGASASASDDPAALERHAAAAYRKAMARLLLWHYAPAIAWTALHARLLDSRYGGWWLKARYRWFVWIVAAVTTGVVWVVALATTSNAPPSEYPLSYTYGIVVMVCAVVVPVYLLSC